jgi:hypothetical protein
MHGAFFPDADGFLGQQAEEERPEGADLQNVFDSLSHPTMWPCQVPKSEARGLGYRIILIASITM